MKNKNMYTDSLISVTDQNDNEYKKSLKLSKGKSKALYRRTDKMSIGDSCESHDMDYHCYADDTQNYIVVEPRDNLSDMSMQLTSCLSDIRDWMCSNLLKLNQDNTELMIFAPKHRAKELTDFSISFGGNIIDNTPYAKHFGAYFHRTL